VENIQPIFVPQVAISDEVNILSAGGKYPTNICSAGGNI